MPRVYTRATHCKRGHEFTPANTHVRTNGDRSCRKCDADRARERRKPHLLNPVWEWERLHDMLANIEFSDTCVEWDGYRNAKNYGRIAQPKTNRKILVNRVALEFKLGRPIARGRCSLHTCDNPPCINPGHLYEGTNADNVRDKMARGRFVPTGHIRRANALSRDVCKNGHRWTEETTYTNPRGSRICRVCSRESSWRRHDRLGGWL